VSGGGLRVFQVVAHISCARSMVRAQSESDSRISTTTVASLHPRATVWPWPWPWNWHCRIATPSPTDPRLSSSEHLQGYGLAEPLARICCVDSQTDRLHDWTLHALRALHTRHILCRCTWSLLIWHRGGKADGQTCRWTVHGRGT